LQTARAINGVNFDGTAAITVTAAAGTLTGATLASGVTASSLTSVGTLGSLTVSGTTSLATSSGFSQIGTASNYTSSKLQVYGNIDLVNTSTSQFIRFYDGTTFKGGLGTDDWVGGSSANLTLVSNGDSVFRTTGSATERMRIVGSSGNVGIGTASPSYRLHVSASDTSNVVGGSAAAINISNSNAAAFSRTVDLNFSVGGGASAERIAGLSAVYTSYGTSVGGALAFCTNNGSSSFAERMRIDSSGNVGIGTASPSAKLSIYTGSAGTIMTLQGIGTQFGFAQGVVGGGNTFELQTRDATTSTLATRYLIRGATDTANHEWYSGARGSESCKMFLEASTGNVGIGNSTTSPSEKLHVIGNIRASGVYVGNGSTGSYTKGFGAIQTANTTPGTPSSGLEGDHFYYY